MRPLHPNEAALLAAAKIAQSHMLLFSLNQAIAAYDEPKPVDMPEWDALPEEKEAEILELMRDLPSSISAAYTAIRNILKGSP